MTSEVIIDVQPKDISIALLEDKQLVEYQQEQRTESFSVGNIYVAKVKKLMPGLNACFVDVGSERVAFLHYLDLGTQFCSYDDSCAVSSYACAWPSCDPSSSFRLA